MFLSSQKQDNAVSWVTRKDERGRETALKGHHLILYPELLWNLARVLICGSMFEKHLRVGAASANFCSLV